MIKKGIIVLYYMKKYYRVEIADKKVSTAMMKDILNKTKFTKFLYFWFEIGHKIQYEIELLFSIDDILSRYEIPADNVRIVEVEVNE